MPLPVLGVITLYSDHHKDLEELRYFRRLTIKAKQLGLDVVIFSPADINTAKEQINCLMYEPNTKEWKRKLTRFPDMIFDRCRYQKSPQFQKFKQFRAQYNQKITFLNRPLSNKWIIHQVLSKDSLVKPHLPQSVLYREPDDLMQMLNKKMVVYLKPIHGTGGRGILRIDKATTPFYLIEGRDNQRKIIQPRKVTKNQIINVLKTWDLSGHYVIQQGIDLTLSNGRVHDYRLLIQKNGEGKWEVTGCAGRIGANRSITSNLHGGGRAMKMNTLMGYWFPAETRRETIIQEVNQLSHQVVKLLELEYGRLCEIALDIAIDRSGHVWLLEVNPKPAREVFVKIGELETYNKAIVRPIEYAKWLYQQRNKA